MFAHKVMPVLSSLLIILLMSACSSRSGGLPPTPTTAPSPLTALESPIATDTPTPTTTPTETPTSTVTPTLTSTPTSSPRPVATPQIQIIYPPQGTQVVAGQQLTIQSVATASTGVSRIELWADGALYATTPNSNPALITMFNSQMWSSAVVGDHVLGVRAIDNLGQASRTVLVTVTVVTNPVKPAVWFTQPYAPSGRIVVQSDDTVLLDYMATDDAGITRLELWADGQTYAVDTSDGRSTSLEEQHSWSSSTLGDHTLFVRAYDSEGQSSDSAPLIIGVADRNPPNVTINSPANGAQITSAAVVPVAISAGDSKGITRLELCVDNLLYTEWNSSVSVGETPVNITLAWQQPTLGSHTLYVIASDSVGLSTQTPVMTVSIVSPAPPTSTPTPAPAPGPHLAVNPVRSPTTLLRQTITGHTDPNVNVYITSEAGRFYERADAAGNFAITIRLVPQRVNHLVVSAAFDDPTATVTETHVDINGNPLNIQQMSAPTPTPTPIPPTFTPTPVPPTFTPTPIPPTSTPIPPTFTPTPISPTPPRPVRPTRTPRPTRLPFPITPPPER